MWEEVASKSLYVFVYASSCLCVMFMVLCSVAPLLSYISLYCSFPDFKLACLENSTHSTHHVSSVHGRDNFPDKLTDRSRERKMRPPYNNPLKMIANIIQRQEKGEQINKMTFWSKNVQMNLATPGKGFWQKTALARNNLALGDGRYIDVTEASEWVIIFCVWN